MTSQAELRTLRRAYAKQIAHAAGTDDPRIEAAFAELAREDFLGPPPWRLPATYGADPPAVDDPLYLYQDRTIALRPDKRLNNGQPSFIAMLIGLGRPIEGERVVHIGTGTGYYTALISRLVGDGGSVLGIEYEVDLAREARRNLQGFGNVTIVEGDGFSMPLEPADIVYVNAGTPRVSTTWLDALKPGARLVLPLCTMTSDRGQPLTRGVIFLIERDASGFAATCKVMTAIYPCMGASEPDAEAALAKAFADGGVTNVRRLCRSAAVPDERCWLRGPDWSFAYAEGESG